MSEFGDVRVEERAAWMMEQLVATGSCVLRKVGGDRAGEMACHRFLSSRHSSIEAILSGLAARSAAACAGRHVVCIQDTSEIHFKGRAAKRRGFGVGSDGQSPAFFLHPLLAVDAEEEAVLGLVGAEIWTRPPEKAGDRHRRAPEDKESRRWLSGARCAGEQLADAASVTVVADRESDVYTLFAGKPAGVELLVRARHDRALRSGQSDAEGEDGQRLFEALAAEPAQERSIVKIGPRGPGDKGREAMVELRSRRVRLARPSGLTEAQAAEAVEMTVVEAREPSPPAGKAALHWRLLSSADITPQRAVQLYRLRWRIEQLFRTCKSDGLRFDETQMHDAGRLMKFAAMALGAAARIMQLVDARDGSRRPATDGLDARLQPALVAISKTLEGRTARQKNPHPPDSLAFLAWVCARLGGWNCYYKPPGPKTMRSGWETLAAQLTGFTLASRIGKV